MEKKAKVNWWVLLAIVVIGVPVGFVGMGFFNRVGQNNSIVIPETLAVVTKTDSVLSFSDESIRPVDSVQVLQKVEQETNLAEKKVDKKVEKEQNEQIKKTKEEHNPITREEQEIKAREKKEAEERKKAELEEKKRLEDIEKKQKEQEELRNKQNELKNNVQKYVASGQKSDVVPDGCTIVINNGQSMDYQSFRNGVKFGSISSINVNKVEPNVNGTAATKVYVTARVATD